MKTIEAKDLLPGMITALYGGTEDVVESVVFSKSGKTLTVTFISGGNRKFRAAQLIGVKVAPEADAVTPDEPEAEADAVTETETPAAAQEAAHDEPKIYKVSFVVNGIAHGNMAIAVSAEEVEAHYSGEYGGRMESIVVREAAEWEIDEDRRRGMPFVEIQAEKPETPVSEAQAPANDAPETVDELQARYPEAYDAWLDSETCEDAALREYINAAIQAEQDAAKADDKEEKTMPLLDVHTMNLSAIEDEEIFSVKVLWNGGDSFVEYADTAEAMNEWGADKAVAATEIDNGTLNVWLAQPAQETVDSGEADALEAVRILGQTLNLVSDNGDEVEAMKAQTALWETVDEFKRRGVALEVEYSADGRFVDVREAGQPAPQQAEPETASEADVSAMASKLMFLYDRHNYMEETAHYANLSNDSAVEMDCLKSGDRLYKAICNGEERLRKAGAEVRRADSDFQYYHISCAVVKLDGRIVAAYPEENAAGKYVVTGQCRRDLARCETREEAEAVKERIGGYDIIPVEDYVEPEADSVTEADESAEAGQPAPHEDAEPEPKAGMKFGELPGRIQAKVKEYLRAYDDCSVTYERGAYHVSAGAFIKENSDFKVCGRYSAEDIFTPEERVLNYANSFYEYPIEYHGKRDYRMMKAAQERRATLEYDAAGNIRIAVA